MCMVGILSIKGILTDFIFFIGLKCFRILPFLWHLFFFNRLANRFLGDLSCESMQSCHYNWILFQCVVFLSIFTHWSLVYKLLEQVLCSLSLSCRSTIFQAWTYSRSLIFKGDDRVTLVIQYKIDYKLIISAVHKPNHLSYFETHLTVSSIS